MENTSLGGEILQLAIDSIVKVKDVSIGIRNKDKRGKSTGYSSTCINFNMKDNIIKGSNVMVKYHPFEVHSININEDNTLDVEAHEVGYWCSKFDHDKNFDIRSLINEEVTLVTDIKEIEKINEQSCWC